MHRRAFNAIYVINVIFESIFSMLLSIGLAVLAGWLLVNRFDSAHWVYIPLILFGTAIGFISLCKLILSSMKALDRIESEGSEQTQRGENN